MHSNFENNALKESDGFTFFGGWEGSFSSQAGVELAVATME